MPETKPKVGEIVVAPRRTTSLKMRGRVYPDLLSMTVKVGNIDLWVASKDIPIKIAVVKLRGGDV